MSSVGDSGESKTCYENYSFKTINECAKVQLDEIFVKNYESEIKIRWLELVYL
jgi:hypothetical protein